MKPAPEWRHVWHRFLTECVVNGMWATPDGQTVDQFLDECMWVTEPRHPALPDNIRATHQSDEFASLACDFRRPTGGTYARYTGMLRVPDATKPPVENASFGNWTRSAKNEGEPS